MKNKNDFRKPLLVAGNRPQYIKAETLLTKMDAVYVNTGQHYGKMADSFIKTKPDYNLEVGSNTPTRQLAEMLLKLTEVYENEKPSVVFVIGDTNTTLAAALVANQMNIPLVHVEAGLRSYENMPEEHNRVIVDHISDLLFCPTRTAVVNLKKEGIVKGVYQTGDVLEELIRGEWKPNGYRLATIHRQANVDNRESLENLLKKIQGCVLPLHPRTKKRIEEFNLSTDGIKIIEPVGFEEMLELERHAEEILTDSGGVQREAYLLGVPCTVLRGTTEWEELKTGKPDLLGHDASSKIIKIVNDYLGCGQNER